VASISPQKVERLIAAAVECALAKPHPAVPDFEAALTDAGCLQELVRPLANFIPEAFGRVLLQELDVNVADECEYQLPDGTYRKARLSGDAMWVLVEAAAYAMSRDPKQRQDFAAIAVHSAAVSVLNKVYDAGDSPEGATYASVFLGMPADYR
jgi:hypothetical protein